MTKTPALSRLAAALLACAFAGPATAADAGAAAKPAGASSSASAESARPAVGTPLMQAEALVKAGRFADALAKTNEAEKAVADPTLYEQYITARVKAAAALGAGQHELAFAATEAAIATNRLTGAAQLELIASLVHAAYNAKDHARAAKWADRYLKEGGTHASIGALRLQSLYLAGDFAAVIALLQAQVSADEAAGRVTAERPLQLLANAQLKTKDEAGAQRTLERLALHHGKPAYWSQLAARVDVQALPERLFIDYMRFIRATGNLAQGDQALSHASLAIAATLPGEALSVLNEAEAKGLFKEAGADKYKALRDTATKQLAQDMAARPKDEAAARASRDGNAYAMLGQALVGEGKLDAGIAAMEQAIAKGGLRHPEELRLRLGEAQALGNRGPAAVQTLAGVKGSPGAVELARLWSLYATRKPAGPASDMAGTPPAPKAP